MKTPETFVSKINFILRSFNLLCNLQARQLKINCTANNFIRNNARNLIRLMKVESIPTICKLTRPEWNGLN